MGGRRSPLPLHELDAEAGLAIILDLIKEAHILAADTSMVPYCTYF
jgi:hypothetical protein